MLTLEETRLALHLSRQGVEQCIVDVLLLGYFDAARQELLVPKSPVLVEARRMGLA